MRSNASNTDTILSRLKDFQRRTVNYVFRRLYLDSDKTDRFLVADEVGLGKTLVARGIIAKAIDFLDEKIERIDVVYVCSNISIASQNINRLNVSGMQEFVRPTRLSLLPVDIAGIRKNHVNYVSLTPGTSFDPKSREGTAEERALLFHILKKLPDIKRSGLDRMLQCRVRKDNWKNQLRQCNPDGIDKKLCDDFLDDIRQDYFLYNKIRAICNGGFDQAQGGNQAKLELILELRVRLGETSLNVLEPDLIILDEFQRFKNLLDKNNPEARLAEKLFNYKDVKVLLLSATPYKMLTLDHEQGEEHYTDFLETLKFLFNDSEEAVREINDNIGRFRRSLYRIGQGDDDTLFQAREALEYQLSRVMCRTERVDMTESRDAMITECRERPKLETGDLHGAVLADKIASSVGARDIIEYWKSSPYLVNFLRRYELREKLETKFDDTPDDLLKAFSSNDKHLLRKSDMYRYKEIPPANPRMRDLFSNTLDQGQWKLLWLPPSMPYSNPGGPYADVQQTTKSLVFSAWNVVPDAIAALCSYEAERRMVSSFHEDIPYEDLHTRLRPLLRFARTADGRLSGMYFLGLLYPSPTLASLIDPLRIALDCRPTGMISPEEMIKEAERILEPHVQRIVAAALDTGPKDLRWYWAALALLDRSRSPVLRDWVINKQNGWLSIVQDREQDGEDHRFKEHLDLFSQALAGRLDSPLGRPPEDLLKVLGQMAVASPGVCALRMLLRLCPSLQKDSPDILNCAARISEGFRTLFNLPETIALLRGNDPETSYWKLVLNYCLKGNIQSMLDEHGHCLVESLGVADETHARRAREIADSIASSLSIHTPPLWIDEITPQPAKRKISLHKFNIRCRFALRFAEIRSEEGSTLARADRVRDAFNSPFRPFVLATTSIGQEGLDFHTWCHRVVHWNLPSNPVDLEQREGRINRYKGHAIRKNIALAYGLETLKKHWPGQGDPWNFLFELARENRPDNANDLVPYWLFEVKGGTNIERRIPILPYSKEVPHLQRLKNMLALYRLVFGQPRQEDLLNYLETEIGGIRGYEDSNKWRISLVPPLGFHS